MQNSITWVGMDVHAENIVLTAVRGSTDAVLFRAEFPNTPKGRERLAGRLAENAPVRCVYEAGPCGYELRRFLEGRGIECDVAAPGLIPRKRRRPRQDRPQGRRETRKVSPPGRAGHRLRPHPRAGSAARSLADPRGCQGGLAAKEAPALQVPPAPGAALHRAGTLDDEALAQEVHETARKRKTERDRGRRRGEGVGRFHLGAWARIISRHNPTTPRFKGFCGGNGDEDR